MEPELSILYSLRSFFPSGGLDTQIAVIYTRDFLCSVRMLLSWEEDRVPNFAQSVA